MALMIVQVFIWTANSCCVDNGVSPTGINSFIVASIGRKLTKVIC